jgi:hypothetical protein
MKPRKLIGCSKTGNEFRYVFFTVRVVSLTCNIVAREAFLNVNDD